MSPRTNKTKPVPGIFYPEEQFKRMMVTLTLLVCIALSWYLYTYMDYGLRAFFFYIYYLPILTGAIYSTSGYGGYLETGLKSKKYPPQPYFYPALMKNIHKLPKNIKAHLT